MVAVERNTAGVMPYRTAATSPAAASTTTASTAARTMATTTHTFHIHAVAVTLSILQALSEGGGTHCSVRERPGDQLPLGLTSIHRRWFRRAVQPLPATPANRRAAESAKLPRTRRTTAILATAAN
jgi:hypothetical protein